MAALEQAAEWPEVEVEVVLGEPELVAQLRHPLVELHERAAEALDLLFGQAAGVDPAQRLALHQLAQELDDGQHELRQALLDRLRVGVDPAAERAPQPVVIDAEARQVRRSGQHLVAHRASAKEKGAHGPVQTSASSGCAASSSRTRAAKAPTASRSTRYAARSSSRDGCTTASRASGARASCRRRAAPALAARSVKP